MFPLERELNSRSGHRWAKCLPKSVKMLKVIYCLNALVAVGGFGGVSNPEQGDFKEVVAIQRDGAPTCLGVFVVGKQTFESIPDKSTEFIATAAHCVYGVEATKLKVVLKASEEKELKVKRVMVHPYYLPPSFDYDIALLKMDKKDKQPGLYLHKGVPTPGDLKAFRWDKDKTGPQPEDAKSEDRKSCRAKLANHIIVSPRMLCAHTNSVTDGSPLIIIDDKKDKHIVGLGSYYGSGGSEINPKIFTSTANPEIYSFIERYID